MAGKSCDICGKVGHSKSTCMGGGQGGGGGGGNWGMSAFSGPSGGGNRVGDNNCLCCGQTGHRKADCPMAGKSCDICGKVGHLKSTCNASGMSAFPGPSGGGNRVGDNNCLCCGETG